MCGGGDDWSVVGDGLLERLGGRVTGWLSVFDLLDVGVRPHDRVAAEPSGGRGGLIILCDVGREHRLRGSPGMVAWLRW